MTERGDTTAPVRSHARRWLAGGAVVLTFATLLILAGRQEHPGSIEFVGAALVLLVGLVAALALLDRDDLRPIAPFVLGGLVALTLIGWLKPTNFVAVALVLGHPVVFVLVAALVVDRSYLPLGRPGRSELCSVGLGIVVGVALLCGTVAVLFEPHLAFTHSYPSDAGPTWIDRNEGGFAGGCSASHGFLRTGTGLGLREEYLGDACEGSPVFEPFRLEHDPPGATRKRSDAIVCTSALTHLDLIVIEFDPATLAGAEHVSTRCA